LRLGGIYNGGEAGERDIDLECVLIECVPYTGDLDWTEFTMVAKQASFLNVIQVANVLHTHTHTCLLLAATCVASVLLTIVLNIIQDYIPLTEIVGECACVCA
jgi:hypothetical protein